MRILNDPVTVLAGVGEKRGVSLAILGIHTIEDLLTYYPFRYEDIQERNLDEMPRPRESNLKRTCGFSTCHEPIWIQKKSITVSNDARSCSVQCFFFQSTLFKR